MKLTYDPTHNIAYLQLRDPSCCVEAGQVETLHISDELNIDLAPDGTIFGIEFLNANAQLAADPARMFTIVNESLGTSQQVKLSA